MNVNFFTAGSYEVASSLYIDIKGLKDPHSNLGGALKKFA